MKYKKIDNYNDFFNIIQVKEDNLKDIISDKHNQYLNPITLRTINRTREVRPLKPYSELLLIQKKLKDCFFDNILLSENCYGFRKGYSYFDYLAQHKDFYGKKYYIKYDLRNFFDSISYDLLNEVFDYYIVESSVMSLEQKLRIQKYLLEIITLNNKVIQGSPVSPGISNIVFRQLDIRIQKYCEKLEVEYSRYADDILFSSDNKYIFNSRFDNAIKSILLSKNFEINPLKTVKIKDYISVNGFVIDKSIHFSRKKLKSINRIIHFINRRNWKNTKEDFEYLNIMLQKEGDFHHFTGKYELLNYLTGYRAFLLSGIKYFDNEKQKEKCLSKIRNIEYLVISIDEKTHIKL